LNGLMIDGSMNDMTCAMYGAMTSLVVTWPRRATGGGSRSLASMSRMSEMPASPLNGNASLRTSFIPLYCFGLCDAVIWTPPSCRFRATAK